MNTFFSFVVKPGCLYFILLNNFFRFCKVIFVFAFKIILPFECTYIARLLCLVNVNKNIYFSVKCFKYRYIFFFASLLYFLTVVQVYYHNCIVNSYDFCDLNVLVVAKCIQIVITI